MKEKIIHLTISLILITLSFIIGSSFGRDLEKGETEKLLNKNYRVDLSLTGSALKVQKGDTHINIYLNGDILEDDKKIPLSK